MDEIQAPEEGPRDPERPRDGQPCPACEEGWIDPGSTMCEACHYMVSEEM